MPFSACLVVTINVVTLMFFLFSSIPSAKAQRPTCGMAEPTLREKRDTARLVRSAEFRLARGGFDQRLFQGFEFNARVDVVFHVIYGAGNRGEEISMLKQEILMNFNGIHYIFCCTNADFVTITIYRKDSDGCYPRADRDIAVQF